MCKSKDLLDRLDEMCQVTLEMYGSAINFYTFCPKRGNALHVACKIGLTEMAKEILSQGYQRLLLEPATYGEESVPLHLAWKETQRRKETQWRKEMQWRKETQWRMVKAFLEALHIR